MFRLVWLAGTCLLLFWFANAAAPLADAVIVGFVMALGTLTVSTSIAVEETRLRASKEPGTLSFAELGGAGRLSQAQSGSNK
jgi:hypothetical protein